MTDTFITLKSGGSGGNNYNGSDMIYYIWNFITNNIKAKLAEANVTLIALIDRIRMLDNDIIRLQQKLDTVIEIREVSKDDSDNPG